MDKRIQGLNHALDVLSSCGELDRKKSLNLISKDEFEQKIYYEVNKSESGYILEVIELRPRIKQIQNVIKEISHLIFQRDKFLTSNDKEQNLFLTNVTK